MVHNYRPWGKIEELLRPYPTDMTWKYIGTLSSEDRSLESFIRTNKSISINDCSFIRITNSRSRYNVDYINRQAFNLEKLKTCTEQYSLATFDLFYNSETHRLIELFDSYAGNANIILDISCMPKRFFFPLIKRLMLKSELIQNLIVTNTIPARYPNEPLAEDYSEWMTLPLFADLNQTSKDLGVMVGVGHLPMGSPEPLNDFARSATIHLFLPFPGSYRSYYLTWRFVSDLLHLIGRKTDNVTICNVNARDASTLFDHLKNNYDVSTPPPIIVPYGPKPFSLAMALFSCKNNCPVYYTQPKTYHSNYSIGVDDTYGTIGYSIITNGRCLY